MKLLSKFIFAAGLILLPWIGKAQTNFGFYFGMEVGYVSNIGDAKSFQYANYLDLQSDYGVTFSANVGKHLDEKWSLGLRFQYDFFKEDISNLGIVSGIETVNDFSAYDQGAVLVGGAYKIAATEKLSFEPNFFIGGSSINIPDVRTRITGDNTDLVGYTVINDPEVTWMYQPGFNANYILGQLELKLMYTYVSAQYKNIQSFTQVQDRPNLETNFDFTYQGHQIKVGGYFSF